MREQPVRRRHRNGALHVRVRRHQRRLERLRLVDHHALQAANGRVEPLAASIVQSRVAVAHLIVAAAARVQLRRDVADLLVQQRSMSVCTSSSVAARLLRRRRAARPRRRARARCRLLSSSVSTPARHSATAHAFESWTSYGQSRKSMPIELFSASNSGAGPPANRPPHSLCDVLPTRRRSATSCVIAICECRLASDSSIARIGRGDAPCPACRPPSPDP